jgi:hypothetical protein
MATSAPTATAAYRLTAINPDGSSSYRIVDEFSTGQISAYALHKVDSDHIEMNMQDGGSVKLQRCK